MRGMRAALLATSASLAALVLVVPAQALLVHVEGPLAGRHDIHISFRAAKLPAGGYYYALVVLRPYKKYTKGSPPPCSASSNMYRANYGYPDPHAKVVLTLTPSESRTHHWCLEGTYDGGVYAVPAEPPCREGTYPCYYKERIPQCFETGGRRACGIVVQRRWRYPEGLPAPQASGTRIVAHFTVKFAL